MEVTAFLVDTGQRREFRRGLAAPYEPGVLPHPYYTYLDAVNDTAQRFDLDMYGFDGKVWSSLDGPFSAGRPADRELHFLRVRSRCHSAHVRFNYPSYLLFIVPNTRADKVEVFFRPTVEVCALPLVCLCMS